MREGTFREDLFYRLNVLTLEIPPLRERRQDVRLLAERFLTFFGRQYHRPGLTLTAEALCLLLDYPWPGNVRELRNAVERATMLVEGPQVGPELLLPKAGLPGPASPVPAASSAAAMAPGSTASKPPAAGESGAAAKLQLGDLAPLSQIEQEHIRRVLARAGSLREAAAILGIDQATLWRRRKQHGL